MVPTQTKYKLIVVSESEESLGAFASFLTTQNIEMLLHSDISTLETIVGQLSKHLVGVLSLPSHQERLIPLSAKFKDIPLVPFSEKRPSSTDEWINFFKIHFNARLEALNEFAEILACFVDDIFPLMEKLESLLTTIEEGAGNTETLSAYMRILHTIKGTASSVGFTTVGSFAHKYEGFVSTIQSSNPETLTPSAAKISKGYDQLKKMLHEAINGTPADGVPDFENIFTSAAAEKKNPTNESANSGNETQAAGEKGNIGTPADEKIFVSLSILNDFIDASAKLITVRSTFQQSIDRLAKKLVNDPDIRELQVASRQFNKEITVLKSTSEHLRKVPLGTIFKPLRRMVRELTKSLGKKVRLDVIGEELQVDRTIATLLSNCLVHMLRNCVDHGLETPEERVGCGKKEEGEIRVTVNESNGWIKLEIRDDGRGINPAIIRKKALQLQLYTDAALNKMTENEIQSIIFAPGFSTAVSLSDVSGRGVGADMVKTSIQAAGGNLRLDSKVGLGTSFQLNCPLPDTCLVMQVILIKVSSYIFALHQNEIISILSMDYAKERNQLVRIAERPAVFYRDEYYPVLSLGVEPEHINQEGHKSASYVLMCHEGKRFSVFADSLLSNEECIGIPLDGVTKNLLKSFEKVVLLGSGGLALLVDSAAIRGLSSTINNVIELPLNPNEENSEHSYGVANG